MLLAILQKYTRTLYNTFIYQVCTVDWGKDQFRSSHLSRLKCQFNFSLHLGNLS